MASTTGLFVDTLSLLIYVLRLAWLGQIDASLIMGTLY